MKLLPVILLVLAGAYSAVAQGGMRYVPCLVDVQEYPTPPLPPRLVDGVWVQPGRPEAIWRAPKAVPVVYKIGGGSMWQIPIVMPVAGNCTGSFEAYDDRDDVAVAVADALGRYIRKQPPGDIEVMIVDELSFAQMNRRQNYVAYYSSGRQFSGRFDVPLRAGYYRLLISNRHSLLARKSVTFALGQTDAAENQSKP